MSPEPHSSVEVFYSYAHEDEKLRDELKKHLSNLKRQDVITDWYDRDISAGKEWNDEIERHLNSAKVILFLVSPDFMNSDYINDVEVKRAMERHESGEACIIPVILRPVDWNQAYFGKLQALPKNAKPVTRWTSRDEAFLDIARGIRRAVQEQSESRHVEKPSNEAIGSPLPTQIPDVLRVAFVSRKDRENRDIVERLREELAPNTNRLIALWGAGGVGKTAIAAEVTRELLHVYNQRIVWVSADGRDDFTVASLLDDIATATGNNDVRKLSIEPKKERIRELLVASPMLIVLDNFETIDPEEGLRCVEWLSQPGLCSALVTTRQNITLAHRNIPIDTMSHDEATMLLQWSIAEARDQNAFANLDRDRVIDTSGGNPLVLQWIVRQIDLAEDSNEVLDDLKQGEGTAADRVFERSYRLKQLDNGGRAVLLALSLFVPSATRRAVADIAGLGKEKDRKRFRNAVRTLSSLWLLRTAESGERLAIEGLTRELAANHLSHDLRLKSFSQRFVSRYLRFASEHSRQSPEDFDLLESEKDNLVKAMDVAFELHDWGSVMLLLRAIAFPGMLDTRGYWDDVIQKGEQAVEAAQFAHDVGAIAEFSANTATTRKQRGEFDEAKLTFQKAIEAFRELDENENLAVCIHNLASIALDQGAIEEASRLFNESLEISRKFGYEDILSATLHYLGMLAHHHGNLHSARAQYEESFAISTRLDDQIGIATSLHQLGLLAHDQGQYEEARRLYDASLVTKRKLGYKHGIAATLHQLGTIAFDQNQNEEARKLYRESLVIAEQLGDQEGIASSFHQLGRLAQEEGELDEARRLYNEALAIQTTLGARQGIAGTIHQLGALAHREGDLVEARQLFNESLRIEREIGSQFGIANTLAQLGLLAEHEGDNLEARLLFLEALSLFEKLHSPKADSVRQDLNRLRPNRLG